MSNKVKNPRLSRRLSIVLALTLLLMLVIATLTAAASAYFEAREMQDETLLSVGYLVSSQQVSVQYNARVFRDNDFDDGVRVWELGRGNLAGFSIEPTIETGFHTLDARRDRWRALIVDNQHNNTRYAVVQKLSLSTELAARSAKNTAIPLLGLLLLTPVMIYFIVLYSFKPLRKLRQQIDQSDKQLRQSLHRESIPFEVEPFVRSIENLLNKNHEYNERQRRFIADAAHELRTPITALSLEIENLEQAKDEQTRERRQAQLAGSVDRLQRLISQLLDLARSQASESAELQTISLNELVRDQLSQLFMLADSKNIEIAVTRNEPVTWTSSPSQLRHLVQNGLSNAIKFTPEGGQIEIHCFQEGDRGVFAVYDNGPGVPPDQLKLLTEPFFRSEEHATGVGAGLGLAICQEIADSLNGELTLKNRKSGGFEFRYSQPM